MERAAATGNIRGGPRTIAGRARAAGNRLTHGLDRSIRADPASAAAVEALTRQLSQNAVAQSAEAKADDAIDDLAHAIAEAQVDLARVRHARHHLIDALSEFATNRESEDLRGIADVSARLATIDRYERRARSRSRLAIRAFDAVQRMRYKNTASLAVRTRNSATNSARVARKSAPPPPLRPVAPDLTLAADSERKKNMWAAHLDDRGVVRVAGEDARKFLNGLLTTDIGKVTAGRPAYAALLTPQGKIIVDFLVAEPSEGVFLLDCPRGEVQTLMQRLTFYKLRAKVTIEDVSEHLQVFAAWDGASSPVVPAKAGTQNPGILDSRFRGNDQVAVAYPDPRLPALGFRVIAERGANVAEAFGAEPTDTHAYTTHRIAQGAPEGGVDFAYNDAFPHEACMDQLSGVDFKKGCYIGQEVVSRMEHRGTARTRVVPLTCVGAAPAAGTPVTAGGKPMGEIGSGAANSALALLRLDRVAEALQEGSTLEAGGVALTLHKPAWARFAFPGEGKAET
jgi:folate-binding protein YgfZ